MDDLSQFKQLFFTESAELLADMETRLLSLDENADSETLNAIFRCAHSIKGSAGAFGFTHITQFTHTLEALLDKLREGEIHVTTELTDLLLKGRDVVNALLEGERNLSPLPPDYGDDILQALHHAAQLEDASAHDIASEEESATQIADTNQNKHFEVQFVPHRTFFQHGHEPILLLRELRHLSTAMEVKCNASALPGFDALIPEDAFLHWHITLETTFSENAIREVFEFAEMECDLYITSLASGVASEDSNNANKISPNTTSASKAKNTASSKQTSISAAKQNAASSASETSATEAATPSDSGAPNQSATAKKPTAAGGKNEAAKSESAGASSIRVDIEKVDRLINMVGEIVITQSMLAAQASMMSGNQYQNLMRGIEELSQHTRELQEAVMAIRMQPVKSIFSRMPRMVRDLAQQLGKDIRLEMQGEQTEVDKTIIEQLSDPLTHMIRNSVDHGIESPATRTENGKAAQGVIILSAEHRGGKIVIEVQDDGGGINRSRVLEKAREKGLIAADAQLSDVEIDQLVFAPGFSTAATVSNVSGRGVGMDVVRRNIEALGGQVSIRSTPGEGTCMSIALPLTLAILDGMIVRVGQECYVIPIPHIIETLRPKKDAVQRVAHGNSVINVRGEFLPVLRLYELFNVREAIHAAEQALIVLVESDGHPMGLMVDELVGQQQVVIKSLEENADPIAGVSGATILGDGKVSLILDIAGLQKISGHHMRAHAA